MSKWNEAERERQGKSLEAGGRRAGKELGMPIPREGSRLKNKGAGLDLNQDDNGRGNGHGRCRVHQDAQRAVVGVAFERVNVGHLHHGQQRQQDQAHHGHQRPGSLPGAAFSA